MIFLVLTLSTKVIDQVPTHTMSIQNAMSKIYSMRRHPLSMLAQSYWAILLVPDDTNVRLLYCCYNSTTLSPEVSPLEKKLPVDTASMS